MSVRLERHERNALAVARWLQTRPEISRVLYPALPEDPGHELWKRDFLGASGLFGVVLDLPRWLVDASPLQHVARVPAARVDAVPLVVLSLCAAALTTLGLARIGKRDLSG